MAIVFMDGFDLYNQTSDIQKRWSGTPPWGSFQTGRFGGRAARLTSSNSVPGFVNVTSGNTFTVGFAVRTDNLAFSGSGSDILQFRNSTTVITRIGIASNGAIRAGRGDYTSNLIIGSATGLIVANNWYYVEVEFTRNASTGRVIIYINGVQVADSGGSANTGASAIDNIAITSGGTDNKDFDDLYIRDSATRLGESRIETIRPSADSSVQWTPNASTNVSRVNTTLIDDDTTYNASSTVGHKDLFDMGNLSSAPQTIHAVQTFLSARKDDAATREVRVNMKNGTTTTNGTTRAVGASYQFYTDIYEVNPDDAAPFVDADISAMQLGYEVVT